MPLIEIESKSQGPARINYVISTPTSNSADSIEENLPTLLFFHIASIAYTWAYRVGTHSSQIRNYAGSIWLLWIVELMETPVAL